MTRDEVAALVHRVAREVVGGLGIVDPERVDDRAVGLAYDRLWEVDKLAVELHTDRFKVKSALQLAARDCA